MDAQWQQYYWNHYLLQQQHHQQLANPDTTVSPPTATHHTYNPTGTYGPLTHALRTHQAHHSHPYTTSPYTPPPQHTPPQQAPPSQPEFPPPPPPPLPTADPVTPPPSTYKQQPTTTASCPRRHCTCSTATSHPISHSTHPRLLEPNRPPLGFQHLARPPALPYNPTHTMVSKSRGGRASDLRHLPMATGVPWYLRIYSPHS